MEEAHYLPKPTTSVLWIHLIRDREGLVVWNLVVIGDGALYDDQGRQYIYYYHRPFNKTTTSYVPLILQLHFRDAIATAILHHIPQL